MALESRSDLILQLDSVTEPLCNGAELPVHPANSTAYRIVKYGRVWDDADGTPLHSGLHQNEIQMLMSGHNGGLGHLYVYAIRNNHIYHSRHLVNIDVEVEDAEP